MPKNILVVGMPRSGTSLAAALFTRKGYFVGDIESERLRTGNSKNPFGFFEADELVERNVNILRRAGYEFHNTWLFSPISDSAINAVPQLPPEQADRDFVQRYEARAPWLWKDPRLCITLPYWWKLLDHERVAVVLTTRDSADIYWSFRRFGWNLARDDVVRRVEQHVRAAKRAVDALGIPHVAVGYNEYRERPAHVANVLSRLAEIELTPDDLNFRPELDHSSPGGKATTVALAMVKKLPRAPVRRVERQAPRWLLGRLFPERAYSPPRQDAG